MKSVSKSEDDDIIMGESTLKSETDSKPAFEGCGLMN